MAFEEGFNHADGNRRHKTVAHVLYVVVLAVVFLNGAGNVFLKSTLVRTALCGMLPVDVRIILLAVLRRMRKGNVDALALDVHNGVECGGGKIIGEQVFQTVATHNAATVVEDRESRVEVGVIAEHEFHKFTVVSEVLEERRVGGETDVRTVLLLRICVNIIHQITALKRNFVHLAVSDRTCNEAFAQGVYGFQTHTVQSYGSGKYRRVVLTPCVQLRHGGHETSQGNATSVVANGTRGVVGNVHLNALTETFVKFVYRIVDGFLQQHVDTIIGMRTIAQATDIHTGAQADVIHVFEVAYFTFVVIDGGGDGGFHGKGERGNGKGERRKERGERRNLRVSESSAKFT